MGLEIFEQLEDFILAHDKAHPIEGLVEFLHSEVEHHCLAKVFSLYPLGVHVLSKATQYV